MPIADVPAELVCGFCDDLYAPKSAELIAAYSEIESKDLAHLYGLLCEAAKAEVHSVAELRKSRAWPSTRAARRGLRASSGSGS